MWRAIILADVPNLVLGHGRLTAHLAHMNPVVERTGGVQLRIIVTAEGTDAVEAGQQALDAVRDALGPFLKGDSDIESVEPDEDPTRGSSRT